MDLKRLTHRVQMLSIDIARLFISVCYMEAPPDAPVRHNCLNARPGNP